MLLKYFYDPSLAHASYLVGCQRTGSAVVVDPGRDVEQYLEAADREGLELTAVAETHIHADYVSGARELAERVAAKLYVSDEGPAVWKYHFVDDYESELLHDGDRFDVGGVRFDVMHTPGHTPESLSFLLTDEGGGADRPMGIFTGDFVFVGAIGRPDLLEEAAGIADTAEPAARDLYRSLERFKRLPDFLQIWPAHGAGSACGKGLGAIPSSTVGYEKLFNPALQYDDEESFVRYVLADQPEAPRYFAVMKRVNKEGPRPLGELPGIEDRSPELLDDAVRDGTVIDLSPSDAFASGHVPGTINIPPAMLAAWAGWLVDYDRPVCLIGREADRDEAIRVLRKIGIDRIVGFFRVDQVRSAGRATQSYTTATADEARSRVERGEAQLVDVRAESEWREGHLPGAEHLFLGRLPQHLDRLADDRPVVTQCGSGARSAIAASVLQNAGFEPINLEGGYAAWKRAGLPTTREDRPVASA